jgi:hypothetical protein
MAIQARQASAMAMIAICNVVAVMDCHSSEMSGNATMYAAEAACVWSSNMAIPFIDHSSGMWNPRLRPLIRSPCHERGEAMTKTLMALAAVSTLAISAVVAPAPAHAQRGVGAAIAGGIIGGAIVGGALAGPYGPGYGYYGPGYGYYGGPAYVAEPGYGAPCYWQHQRFWDGYGWRVRNVRVCD